MHFAPQWAKPIKPAGTSFTSNPDPSHVSLKSLTNHLNNNSSIPFPALSQGQISASPVITTTPKEPSLSYSRATHTAVAPNSPAETSYQNGDLTGNGESNPYPFRYSREQILALWDEDKVKETPIELAGMLDSGGVHVSKKVAKPVGLRDLAEVEKKVCFFQMAPP